MKISDTTLDKSNNVEQGLGMTIVAGFLVLFASLMFAQAPQIAWTIVIGDTGNEDGLCVIETVDQGYVIVGRSDSYGAGDYDVYLVKTTIDGDILWARTYGGENDESGYSVIETLDSGYAIVGRTDSYGAGGSDVYFIKTDTDGEVLWTKTYGGILADVGSEVRQTVDGGYIIAGYTYSFGAGARDMYVIKTDGNGDTLWTRTYGGVNHDVGVSVQQTTDNGYIIVGDTDSYGAGGYDVYAVKISENGYTEWTMTYGGAEDNFGSSVQQTLDNGYIIAGQVDYGDGDAYLIKTDPDGNIEWTRTYGGSDYDVALDVQQTPDQGFVTAGYTYSFGVDGCDMYLVRTDSHSDTVWTQTYGGTGNDRGYSIQMTSDRAYITVGYTDSYGAGGRDFYLIKTEPESSIEESPLTQVHLMQVSPNPFNNKVNIKYGNTQSRPDILTLKIYDITGRLVKHFTNLRNAPCAQVSWDGTDDGNRRVPSGVYLLELQIGANKETEHITLIR